MRLKIAEPKKHKEVIDPEVFIELREDEVGGDVDIFVTLPDGSECLVAWFTSSGRLWLAAGVPEKFGFDTDRDGHIRAQSFCRPCTQPAPWRKSNDHYNQDNT